MDPGTATLLAAAISGGTELLGGGLGALGQNQANKASGRQAAQMDPFIEMLVKMGNDIASGGEYGGLRGQAQRELASGGNALNAQLASRGLFDSGVAMSQQRQLSGDVMSRLAEAINADKFARESFGANAQAQAANLVGSTEGFGYYDRESGQTRGK